MLDQSFSVENFRKIIDYENRRGIYLEGRFFPEIAKITEEIKKCNSEIREKHKALGKEAFDQIRKQLNSQIDDLKKQKEEKLVAELEKISVNIVDKSFKIELNRNDKITDKPVYTVDKTPEIYFALKQIQQNFRKLYQIEQANRFEITNQVKCLLGDCFPKIIIRTDIKEFYESIPHDRLLQKLHNDNLLTYTSKKIIAKTLMDYKTKSGNAKGVPRGVGVSAYLAELYMRDIDAEIRAILNVTYYARYVDDMIIIFTPTHSSTSRNFLTEIKKIVEDKYGLVLNAIKTQVLDCSQASSVHILSYLGYKITFGNQTINIRLTDKKKDKYKKRLDLIFASYCNYSKVNEKGARKLLIRRLRFITGNTRLLNNKQNILVGIYFSNSLLNDSSDLVELDAYLKAKENALINNSHLKSRIDAMITSGQLTFKEGFEKRKFSSFTTKELSSITEVWENEN